MSGDVVGTVYLLLLDNAPRSFRAFQPMEIVAEEYLVCGE